MFDFWVVRNNLHVFFLYLLRYILSMVDTEGGAGILGLALTDLEVAQHQIMKIPDRSCPTDSSDMYLICI